MRSVGGNRQSAQKRPRTNRSAVPCSAIAKYKPPAYGSPHNTSSPKPAIASSSNA